MFDYAHALFGYGDDARKQLDKLVSVAIRSGNPALDYIGWGGGVFAWDAQQVCVLWMTML